jgi:hypothetical protein
VVAAKIAAAHIRLLIADTWPDGAAGATARNAIGIGYSHPREMGLSARA